MQIFIINLSRDVKRREFQEKQLQELELNYTILSATSTDDIEELTYKKHYYDWQRALRKSEVACYYSHRRCWEKVISSNQPALILEDDVLLSAKVPSLLFELQAKKGIDLVDLEVTGRKKSVSRIGEPIQGSKLFKLYHNSSGAGGYILFPSGAKKLLTCEQKKGISLADAHIANCYSLDAYQVEPAAVLQFIVCPLYKINKPEYAAYSTSSTNENSKEKKELVFRFKRILSEVKLGIRKIRLASTSRRRYINLDIKDFGH